MIRAALLFSFLLFQLPGWSQFDQCLESRYGEVALFDSTEIVIELDIEYGVAPHFLSGADVSLQLDIYRPDEAIDPVEERPMILLIHGGSFMAGNKEAMSYYCMEYARRGYVAATMSYRLGWGCAGTDFLSICVTCAGNASNLRKAAYCAIQDGHAAMRYLDFHADAYGIDQGNMFLGGESAGSITALHTHYWSQDEADSYIPGISDDLGMLNASGNDLPDNWEVQGIINNCGAILNTSIMQPEDMVPIASFHDDADCVVPYNCGPVIGCFCTNFFSVCGSNTIHNYHAANGVPSQLHPVLLSLNHCSYPAWSVINQASCFMKQVMCGSVAHYTNTDVYSAAMCSATFIPQSDEGCPEDLTGDQMVNTEDLLQFLTAFGTMCN